MNISYELLKTRTPTLNEKDHDEKDFLRSWRDRKIYYSEISLDADICGYYEVDENRREHIVINSSLRGIERLLTMAHEEVHSRLDFPISDEIIKLYRSMKVLQNRQEINADTLALVLIFSLPTLKNFFKTGELPDKLSKYLTERLFIYELYKI